MSTSKIGTRLLIGLTTALHLTYTAHMPINELIGATDAAKVLGVSRSGFHALVNRGEIQPTGVIGKRKIQIFKRSDIDQVSAKRGAK